LAQGRRSVGCCSVESCKADARTKGMCPRHYERQRRALSAKACKVEGCSGTTGNGGLDMCSMHYGRQVRNGTPDESGLVRRAPGVRGTTPCPVEACGRLESPKWQPYCSMHGARAARHGGDGRGLSGLVHDAVEAINDRLAGDVEFPPCRVAPDSLRIRGGSYSYHRFAWWLSTGRELSTEEQLDHMCRNRSCVGIDHLDVVTAGENVRRSVAANGYIRDVGHDPGAQFWLLFFRDHWPR
jgi:hypothetical protein